MKPVKCMLLLYISLTTFKGLSANQNVTSPMKTKVYCQGVMSAVMKCESGMEINVLEANYGANLEVGVCRTDKLIKCVSNSTVLDKVLEDCDGKVSCRVTATDQAFYDPCVNFTSEYLVVNYTCEVPATTTTMAATSSADSPASHLVTWLTSALVSGAVLIGSCVIS